MKKSHEKNDNIYVPATQIKKCRTTNIEPQALI